MEGILPARTATVRRDRQILKHHREGRSIPEIAKMLGISVRSVERAKARAIEQERGTAKLRTTLTALDDPDAPKKVDELADDVKKCIAPTPDGFEQFFNRYSGRILQPVHKKWVTDVLSTHRTLINCPPRHAKSTIFSAWFPIWLLARDRNNQILIASQTEDLAKKFAREIAFHLQYNAQLVQDFGRFKHEQGDWPWRPNSGELLVDGRTREIKSGDLSLQVRGAGQQILGMECNWVIVDDAVSRKHVNSETERERLSEWFHGDVMSRLEPGGIAIVIGQRLHIYDLYGELADEKLPNSKKRWNHINYPAILDHESKQTLWPEKWPYAELLDRYSDVGYAIFEAMYQQNPLPEGLALARRSWFYGDEEHPGCLDLDREAGTPPEKLKRPVRILSLDPSPTKYAGLIVADIDWNQQYLDLHVIEIKREKMNVRDMLREIDRCIQFYAPHYFVFEQNAAQRWLLQDPAMDRYRKQVHIIPHTTSRNKKDPILGVESLATDFEFGRIHLPYGSNESKLMSELLIKEALEYPQGATDDLLMALWFIKTNYKSLMPKNVTPTNTRFGYRTPRRLQHGWMRRKKIG